MAAVNTLRAQLDRAKQGLTGDARRRALIELAHDKLAEAEAHNTRILGRPAEHLTVVDGRAGAAVESVRPGGSVVFLFDAYGASIQRVVDETYRLLLENSPVDGRARRDRIEYHKHHIMTVNGRRVEPPVQLGPDDVVQFTNLLPYARRIEHGWSDQAPNGVYETVATIMRARFAHAAEIFFNYSGYVDDVLVDQFTAPATRGAVGLAAAAMHARGQVDAKSRFTPGSLGGQGAFGGYRHNFSELRFPVIIIRPKGWHERNRFW